MTEGLKYRTGNIGKEKDYITREGVFRYMWMNTELTTAHESTSALLQQLTKQMLDLPTEGKE